MKNRDVPLRRSMTTRSLSCQSFCIISYDVFCGANQEDDRALWLECKYAECPLRAFFLSRLPDNLVQHRERWLVRVVLVVVPVSRLRLRQEFMLVWFLNLTRWPSWQTKISWSRHKRALRLWAVFFMYTGSSFFCRFLTNRRVLCPSEPWKSSISHLLNISNTEKKKTPEITPPLYNQSKKDVSRRHLLAHRWRWKKKKKKKSAVRQQSGCEGVAIIRRKSLKGRTPDPVALKRNELLRLSPFFLRGFCVESERPSNSDHSLSCRFLSPSKADACRLEK